MSWDENRVDAEWLQGGSVAYDAEEIVAAFDRVEDVLGAAWLDAIAARGVTGASPTLGIVTAGLRLQALDGVEHAEILMEKLRAGDASAWAEFEAIWLLRRGASDVLVELEPTVQVGGRERVPDFRVASSDEPWTYVEVTRPDPSETQLKVREVMSALAHLIDDADGRFSLELFLRREPTSGELGELQALLPDFWNRSGPAVQELPNDLGIILLNQHPPGVLVLEEHPGEADSPRLGEMHGVAENNEPVRHLAVRLAYSDERADHFLRTEARQLSPEEPNLIMISTTNTVGGQKSWDAMIRRRLQPNIHTRVGGVALFFGGQVMTDKGLDVQMNVSLIENEHAQCPLPDRIANQLAKSQPS